MLGCDLNIKWIPIDLESILTEIIQLQPSVYVWKLNNSVKASVLWLGNMLFL